LYPNADFQTFLKECGWLDTDFEKYDKRLIVYIFGVYVLWRLVQCSKFYQDHPVEMNRIKLILVALQQPIIILGNDVFIMENIMASGQSFTDILNCICEMIIEVLQFYHCRFATVFPGVELDGMFVYNGIREFDMLSSVSVRNYGDDNFKLVKGVARAFYTHERIMEFAAWINMPITPARKDDALIEFKVVTDIQFLKRTPVVFGQRIYGRLELSSIGKMLAFTDSQVESWIDMVLQQAIIEICVHPVEVQERFKKIFGVVFDADQLREKRWSSYVWGNTTKQTVGDNVITTHYVPCQGNIKTDVQ